MIVAASGGHRGVTQVLLAHGADPRRQGEGGSQALDSAAQRGRLAVVQLLLERDPGLLDLPGYHDRTALAAAAGGGHLELVRLLLARGADARRRLNDGTRALDWAAPEGHVAPGLLRLPDSSTSPVLLVAAHGGHAPVVSALLARGADPRGRGEEGESALDMAAALGHLEVVVALLEFDSSLAREGAPGRI